MAFAVGECITPDRNPYFRRAWLMVRVSAGKIKKEREGQDR
jgi:hypothetical protein